MEVVAWDGTVDRWLGWCPLPCEGMAVRGSCPADLGLSPSQRRRQRI